LPRISWADGVIDQADPATLADTIRRIAGGDMAM
jgi:hypothetical protein